MAQPTRRLRPRKYIVNTRCSTACTLGERQLPGNAFSVVHGWFEEGANNDVIHARSVEAGFPVSLGAIGRHRRAHLEPADQLVDVSAPTEDDGPRETDIQILERLISTGSKHLNSKQVRVSPEMLMKAMELKYKLTQGNVFQGFLDAVNSAMAPDGAAPENPAAVAAPDEQAQASPEAES